MQGKLFICKKTDIITTSIVTVVFLAVCAFILTMPHAAVEGAKNGLSFSFEILIPSLFPFMFLSDFAVEYGISSRLGKFFGKSTEKLFYLPSEAGVTIFLSLIGGFPVGACGINALIKQNKITQAQAQRMFCFCVNSGPAFLISVVGSSMYHNIALGVILLSAQSIVSLIVGICLGIGARKHEQLQKTLDTNKTLHSEFAPAFITSCHNACKATINLCSLVVLFSTFGEIIGVLIHSENRPILNCIIKSVLEVTAGCDLFAQFGLPLFLIPLVTGWAGVSVHFQIFAAAADVKIDKIRFILFRAINGIFSSALTYIIMIFIRTDSEVFSNITETEAEFSSETYYGSAALFAASVLFLVFLNTYIRITNDKIEKTQLK